MVERKDLSASLRDALTSSEAARVRARHGVRGQEARAVEELREELDEHERFGDLHGLGGGLVWGHVGAAIGDGRNLVSRASVRIMRDIGGEP